MLVFKLGQLTGMASNRFDLIWSCLIWSLQLAEREPDATYAQHRWKLVDGFVEKFNNHQSAKFLPGSKICVDESMIKWYGHIGGWINKGHRTILQSRGNWKISLRCRTQLVEKVEL